MNKFQQVNALSKQQIQHLTNTHVASACNGTRRIEGNNHLREPTFPLYVHGTHPLVAMTNVVTDVFVVVVVDVVAVFTVVTVVIVTVADAMMCVIGVFTRVFERATVVVVVVVVAVVVMVADVFMVGVVAVVVVRNGGERSSGDGGGRVELVGEEKVDVGITPALFETAYGGCRQKAPPLFVVDWQIAEEDCRGGAENEFD